MGVLMSESTEQGSDGQLPKFPARMDDQERVERSEKRDRKRDWLPEAISLILDLIGSWH
jgi:hypothetical protein